jgi:acyl carrier protein
MEDQQIFQRVHTFIWQSFIPNEPPESLTEDLDLIDSGVLDSLAMVELADYLEELSGSPVEMHELTRRNVGTLGAIVKFVANRRSSARG